MNKVTIRKVKAPAYRTSIWFIVSKSIIKAIETVEDIVDTRIATDPEKKSIKSLMFAYEKHTGGYRLLIFLKQNSKAGVIAHECHHAMNILLSWHGQKKSQANDEHESYLLEWFVDQAHFTIAKHLK